MSYEMRSNNEFGKILKILLLERDLNKKELSRITNIDPSIITNMCKDDTLLRRPSSRQHMLTIIEKLHAEKPLSSDYAKKLLTIMSTIEESNSSIVNTLRELSLKAPSDNQSNELQVENPIKGGAYEVSVVADTQQLADNVQLASQRDTDKEAAKPDYQEEIRQSAGISRSRLKRYYVLLILICAVALLTVSSWYIFLSPSSTPPSMSLTPLLYQSAPDCNNPSGTLWTFPLPETKHTCTTEGLLMQKNSQGYYAEADLDNVKGTPYNQTRFRVHTQVAFQNPHDTSTRAVLFVQTPQAPGVAGGYMCAINSNGQWQLLEVKGATDIPVISQGAITINLAHPTTITIEVQNSRLYCAIDGTWVVSWPDNLNVSPGAVSLMVIINSPNPSSPIIFSNFELDQ